MKEAGMIAFRADGPLRERIEAAAAAERRTVANLVRAVMCDYLDATSKANDRAAA